ncbi:MAG TPA: DUF202 domain-containing protein [Solirubrobacteraceae bacterium]|jgi:putative membrane protein
MNESGLQGRDTSSSEAGSREADTGSEDRDASRRTELAAERTWLAWWRTGIAIAAAAIAVGQVAPHILGVGRSAYAGLGIAYALLALAIFAVGYRRYRDTKRALAHGLHSELPVAWAALFAFCGAALTLTTIVLILVEG